MKMINGPYRDVVKKNGRNSLRISGEVYYY